MTAPQILPVIWIRQATHQLAEAHEYIPRDSQSAAERQMELIVHAAESLALFPEKGRPGRIAGTRELVVTGTSYIVVYRLRASSIRILAVLHGARRWPHSLANG